MKYLASLVGAMMLCLGSFSPAEAIIRFRESDPARQYRRLTQVELFTPAGEGSHGIRIHSRVRGESGSYLASSSDMEVTGEVPAGASQFEAKGSWVELGIADSWGAFGFLNKEGRTVRWWFIDELPVGPTPVPEGSKFWTFRTSDSDPLSYIWAELSRLKFDGVSALPELGARVHNDSGESCL